MTNKKDLYEYTEYINKLNPEEARWIKKFYLEFHNASFYNGEDLIIVDPETKAESIRNNNSSKRDLILRGSRVEISKRKLFMEDASDTWDIDNAYKIGGPELAISHIFDQAGRDLYENKELHENIALSRFYLKLNKLLKMDYNINRRHKKDKNGKS